MRIAIAGGHGQIAMLLAGRLTAHGDQVISLIRNPDHADQVQEQGGEPVVCDLESATEQDIASAIKGADAAVFAAGAGPGSGPERKLTMDRDGAIKLLHAVQATGIARYLVVSSVGAENPPPGEDTFSVYLRAKGDADAAVRASDVDWMIVRPGRLSDDSGTGRVRLATEPFRNQVPREDVAAVLAALLWQSRLTRLVVYLGQGEDPIDQALSRL